ncbi:polysaccharide deacetylase family protein [Acidimicrobiia bacterium]|nr:polysaccharide deacetylase family protein [Acidimicrobiia bacterium]
MPDKIALYFHETDSKELEDLEKIILYFQERGYLFVTVNELTENLSSNLKHIALTFDDGFSNWIDTLELFKKYNVYATYFINTIQFTNLNLDKFLSDIRCPNSELLISKKEVIKLISHGHEIGAHTHTHKTLSKIDLPQLIEEIEANLEILNEIGAEINNFAIPYGMRRLMRNEQMPYLQTKFNTIAYGEPGMLHHQQTGKLQRYPWKVNKSFKYNLNNIKTDTSKFNLITKRSGLG